MISIASGSKPATRSNSDTPPAGHRGWPIGSLVRSKLCSRGNGVVNSSPKKVTGGCSHSKIERVCSKLNTSQICEASSPFGPMSALGQKRTCAPQKVMSALPPKATAKADFRQKVVSTLLPKADIGSAKGNGEHSVRRIAVEAAYRRRSCSSHSINNRTFRRFARHNTSKASPTNGTAPNTPSSATLPSMRTMTWPGAPSW